METKTQIQKAEQNGYGHLSETDIATLVTAAIIPNGTPPEQVAIFARVCKEKNLSPFSRQIYLMCRNSKQGKRYTIQSGIDGLRAIAERTGVYAGNDEPLFDEGVKQFSCIERKQKQPVTCTVTVYKIVGNIRCPFTSTATFNEYKPEYPNDFMWNKMPYLMIAKVAESLALRKAFPESISGIYSDEEMQQATEVIKKPISMDGKIGDKNQQQGVTTPNQKEVVKTPTNKKGQIQFTEEEMDLQILLGNKEKALSKKELKRAWEILHNQEKASYKKLYEFLTKK